MEEADQRLEEALELVRRIFRRIRQTELDLTEKSDKCMDVTTTTPIS